MVSRMTTVLLLITLTKSMQASEEATDNRTTLYLLGLFPFSDPWPGGETMLPAVQIAIEHINNRSDILPGYRLALIWEDTEVRIHPYLKSKK